MLSLAPKRSFKKKSTKKKGWTWNRSKGNQTPAPELDYCDQVANVSVGSTGSITNIGPFTVGTTLTPASNSPGALFGGRGKLKYLDVRGAWYLSNTVVPDDTNLCRNVIFYDRDARGSTPSLADVLFTIGGSGGSSQGVLSHPNLQNQARITILDDRMFALSSNGPQIKQFSYRVHCKNLLQASSSSAITGVTPTVQSGIWLLIISDSAVAPSPICEFYTRCWYKSLA